MRGRKERNEYAIYKGEKLLAIGKVSEIAKKLNVRPTTVWWWINQKETPDKGKLKIGIRIK